METMVYKGRLVEVLEVSGGQAYINDRGELRWVRFSELKRNPD